MLEGAPCRVGAVKQLCNRVAFPKMTHYSEQFEVSDKPDPNNLAYTGFSLGLHLDLPYYQYNPGTQILHCIRQHR